MLSCVIYSPPILVPSEQWILNLLPHTNMTLGECLALPWYNLLCFCLLRPCNSKFSPFLLRKSQVPRSTTLIHKLVIVHDFCALRTPKGYLFRCYLRPRHGLKDPYNYLILQNNLFVCILPFTYSHANAI